MNRDQKTVRVDAGECPLVSVVLPCLNEARTVGTCVTKAKRSLAEAGISGEVIVSDNGSSDDSVEFAAQAGARVVHCERKGYGAAIQYGIENSRGDFILMADADDSYDLEHLEAFIRPLQEGADMVMGNRFKGGIAPGAMPWKNRYIGNPGLSGVLNLLFRTRAGDAHCGLRSFTREAYRSMQPNCEGMEFASELVVRGSLLRLEIEEVPTTLHPDGRDRPPHLSPWRDGLRHLFFMFSFAPLKVLMLPGLMLFLTGILLLGTWLVSSANLLASPVTLFGVIFLMTGLHVAAQGIGSHAHLATIRLPALHNRWAFLTDQRTSNMLWLAGIMTILLGVAYCAATTLAWSVGLSSIWVMKTAVLVTILIICGLESVSLASFLTLNSEARASRLHDGKSIGHDELMLKSVMVKNDGRPVSVLD